MNTLTLVSNRNDSLEPLIASAVANELRLLEASLRRTTARLRAFEDQYRLTTDVFVARYVANEIQEDMDTIEWLGEHRMAQSIQAQIEALRAIHVVH
jgi:hypothetical protein